MGELDNMAEKIMTLHPAGKSGTNISRQKYDLVRAAIVDAIQETGDIAFKDLEAAVARRLPASFDGSIGWYTTTIKLDLEARGVIERVPGRGPQRLRIRA